jgi:glycosyltransferase involved in cell wall biosynthesis
MRIALVAPTYLAQHTALERRVGQLAQGLAARGAEVEILTQGPFRGEQYSVLRQGVSIRRFPSVVGRLQFPVASGLYDGLRESLDHFDLVDIHTGYAPLARAVARMKFHRRILTPYGVAHRLLSGPYGYVARPIIEAYAQVICSSASERDLLRRRFPGAADRIRDAPPGVDVAAIQSATQIPSAGDVVLAIGRLERANRFERAIAAMAALDHSLRLRIIGEGPDHQRLEAYAADMRLSSRVEFAGWVPDHERYRWLRSARVMVALADEHASGLEVLEAMAAGIPLVATDIPAHREVVDPFQGSQVALVSPAGSPLQVADAVADAGQRQIHGLRDQSVRSEESIVEETWSIYRDLTHTGGAVAYHLDSARDRPSLPVAAKRSVGG